MATEHWNMHLILREKGYSFFFLIMLNSLASREENWTKTGAK